LTDRPMTRLTPALLTVVMLVVAGTTVMVVPYPHLQPQPAQTPDLEAGQDGVEPGIVLADPPMGEGPVLGSVPADGGGVTWTVKRNAGQLQYCYEMRLKRVPDLAGRVEIGWTVSGGEVASLYVVSNDTGDAELASCLTRRIGRWTFPLHFHGDVTWPFVFKAKRR
jgi:hypothetical protein